MHIVLSSQECCVQNIQWCGEKQFTCDVKQTSLVANLAPSMVWPFESGGSLLQSRSFRKCISSSSDVWRPKDSPQLRSGTSLCVFQQERGLASRPTERHFRPRLKDAAWLRRRRRFLRWTRSCARISQVLPEMCKSVIKVVFRDSGFRLATTSWRAADSNKICVSILNDRGCARQTMHT